MSSLGERAVMVQQAYNTIDGMKCNSVQGAMYAFPRIYLPRKAIEEAKATIKLLGFQKLSPILVPEPGTRLFLCHAASRKDRYYRDSWEWIWSETWDSSC